MKKVIWGAVLLIVALFALGAFRANAEQINCGGPTGSYCGSFSPLIQGSLAGEFFQYEIQPSAGSVEAAQRVLAKPSQVSLAQFDVAYQVMQDNPGKLIMTNKLANECLFAVGVDDRLTDWGKVERLATRLRITTAGEGSGSAATLQSVMAMNPNSRLAAAVDRITYQENAAAAVQQVIDGQADVAFFVAYPDPNSSIFEQANNADLQFIGVAHPNMRRIRTEQGEAIYSAAEIPVTNSGFFSDAVTVQTACTAAVILTGNPEQFEAGTDERFNQQDLVTALQNTPASALKPKGDRWDRIFASFKEMTGDAADAVWTAGGDLVDSVTQ